MFMNKTDILTEIKTEALSDQEKKELIGQLRNEIDSIDESIIRLLHCRAGKSELLGAIKKQLRLNNYSPEREKRIIELVSKNDGVNLGSKDIVRIYERIIDVFRSIQKRARDK
jgi:chorismate mutase